MAQAQAREARRPFHRRGRLKIGLAGFDLADPTDRAVAKNISSALRRRGHVTAVYGPQRPPPSAKPDAWHLHLFGRDARGFIAAAERGRWKVVTTLHLVLSDYLGFAGGRRTLERLAALGPVACVSAAQRREALRLAPALRGRLKVVHAYGPSLPPAPPRAERGSVPTLLCAARLAPYKGIDVLLMAFARLIDGGASARLVLAGRDKTRGRLEVFARTLGLGRSVSFAGERTPAALARLMRDADLFVLPSRRENFPIALLEAMAAGKPCVATRAGGIPELTGRHAALLVPAADPKALERALTRVLSDSALRRRLSAAARSRASLFTWDRAAAESEALTP